MTSAELKSTLERLRTACDEIERARVPLGELVQKCLADGHRSADVSPALKGLEKAMMKLLDQLIRSNVAFERRRREAAPAESMHADQLPLH